MRDGHAIVIGCGRNLIDMYTAAMGLTLAKSGGLPTAVYIVVGVVAIFVVLGIVLGAISSASEGKNPLEGAAAGGVMGAMAGLQQGCGCATILALGAIALAIGRWILG